MRGSSLVYYTDDAASDTSVTLDCLLTDRNVTQVSLRRRHYATQHFADIGRVIDFTGCLCLSFKQLYIQYNIAL